MQCNVLKHLLAIDVEVHVSEQSFASRHSTSSTVLRNKQPMHCDAQLVTQLYKQDSIINPVN